MLQELQISKSKIPDFERYEKNAKNRLFSVIFRLFDQTPYFRVKRFLQTIFGNDLEGSYFVQRNRNIAPVAPLSGLVPNSKSGIRAILKNVLDVFSRTPNPGVQSELAGFIFTFVGTKASHTHLEGFGECSL